MVWMHCDSRKPFLPGNFRTSLRQMKHMLLRYNLTEKPMKSKEKLPVISQIVMCKHSLYNWPYPIVDSPRQMCFLLGKRSLILMKAPRFVSLSILITPRSAQ